MNDLEFMSKFKPETRCIKEFKYWIVCLRKKHPTLGSSVILLKRQVASVGDMTPEEGAEFPKVIQWYEQLCTENFGAIKFNYIIMMLKDYFVHYHAFPRYDKGIKKFDVDWKDNDWPKAIDFKSGDELEEDKLIEIKEYMSKY